MRRLVKVLAAAAAALALGYIGDLRATGYYGPELYFGEGGSNVDASPEFYWELEVKRLAGQFHPAEKRVASPTPAAESDEKSEGPLDQSATDADKKDFADALKEGRIKPGDPAKATQQNIDARASLDTDSPPAEFDSEFAAYHRGAFAFRHGKEHWEEARKAWEDLLKRPEQDRHYRSVWAAFMLGKLALKAGDFPAAANWFQRTRELAHAGFSDSLGLAADSYGWEGRSEWKQDHPAKAAQLFLTQLALGDESAIVSLKALIPDRDPVEGMLNYGPESEERSQWNDQQKRDAEEKVISQLKRAAQDPLLRRLVTAHILATASEPDLYADNATNAPVNRCARWLAIFREMKPGQIEDAEYLGWVAYNNGDYKGAAHWLELAKNQTPAAYWLRAKLQRRAGKLADAAKSMTQAWQSARDVSTYTGWSGPMEETEHDYFSEAPHWGFGQSAAGDLAGLHLARGDFVQTLDFLMKGNLWEDAAFVAERVLTTNELKKYVDQQPVAAPSGTENKTDKPENNPDKLRYLLGRRLVRENRFNEATPYLRLPYDKLLERYAKALKDGADEKLPKIERARALFTAGWMARFDGMELMGTEFAPDGFAEGGDFEIPDLAEQRRSGVYEKVRYDARGEQKKTRAPIVLKPTKTELQRLVSTKITPDVRFHYRLIAGALAIKAAAFLPNDSEELADVVNTAGLWVKDRDEKTGNQYMRIIERRCASTEIGRADIAKHWFVDQSGPWSTAQQQAYEALHKELEPDRPAQ